MGLLHQQLDGAVAEHPDADVGQVVVVLLQLVERLHRRLLEHLLQHGGCLAATDEDAVVLGHRGGQPETVADDVGIGHRLQGLGGTDEDIAADHHRVDIVGRHRHELTVEGQLQVEQRLVEPLAALPAEDGHGHQDLAADGIRRQPAALSAGMDEDAFVGRQPVGERATLLSPFFTEQPRRTATAT